MCADHKEGQRKRKEKNTFLRGNNNKSLAGFFFIFFFAHIAAGVGQFSARRSPAAASYLISPNGWVFFSDALAQKGEKREEGEDRGVESDDADCPEGKKSC